MKKTFLMVLLVSLLSACGNEWTDTSYNLYSNDVGQVTLKNFSSPEEFGRWTDGANPTIVFPRDLPSSFDLKLSIIDVTTANSGKPIVIQIGNQKQNFTVVSGKGAEISLNFKDVPGGVREIELVIPSPVSPKESGSGNDIRKLGLAIKSFEIIPMTK